MNGLLGIVLLQYMLSATAGLVDQSRGPANVRKLEQVVAGRPVETGPEGFVELQLTAESYLRVRENSSVVFDSVALADIQIRLTRGNAMIDSDELEPSASIKISAGNLTTSIRKPGIYLFSPDRVKIFNGQLELANGTLIRKGYEAIASGNAYEVRKLTAEEVQHPYAPDKVKIFIEPKEDSSHDIKFLNSVFTKLCSEHFKDLRDVEIVSERSRAAYLLIVSGGREFSDNRVFAHAELKTPKGMVVFSNTETRRMNDSAATDEQPFLAPSNQASKALIQDLLRKMSWR